VRAKAVSPLRSATAVQDAVARFADAKFYAGHGISESALIGDVTPNRIFAGPLFGN